VLDCSASGKTPDHAVALVGYEHNVTMPDKGQWNVFVLKNSWGTGWGDKGYIRLRECSGLPKQKNVGAANMFRSKLLLPRRF